MTGAMMGAAPAAPISTGELADPALVTSVSRQAVEAALADPAQPRLVFQPIVDLRRGLVAGYEALGPVRAAPDLWFAAADRLGVGAPADTRFDPVVCGDVYGGYLGIVRPERMMLCLAELKSRPGHADVGASGFPLTQPALHPRTGAQQ